MIATVLPLSASSGASCSYTIFSGSAIVVPPIQEPSRAA
jgi:hypothetical protein